MIDVVYPWVDPSRPGFQADLDLARQAHERLYGAPPHERSEGGNRFANDDFLRYSLRSIHDYAPGGARIHIITAGERPDWLDATHAAIRFLRHDDLFSDPDALPTFNSNAIEACLARLRGVSRQFIYMNDDVFLLAPLNLGHWISPQGQPRFRFESWQMPKDLKHPTPVGASRAYCRSLLDTRFGRRAKRYERPHEPAFFDLEVLQALEREWPDDHARTRRHRFRTHRDFVTPLMNDQFQWELMLANPTALHEPIHTATVLGGLIKWGEMNIDLAAQFKLMGEAAPPFVCINDDRGDEGELPPARAARDAAMVSMFLRVRFPNPAPWEL